MPTGSSLAMRRVALAVLVAAALFPQAASDAKSEAVRSANFTVTSSIDGVRLEARYYRPVARGTYPVVLIPHGGGGNVDSDAPRAQRYASEGFVGVVWSARGHGNSGGFFDFFGPLTVQDTRDVVSWIIDHRREAGADRRHIGMTGYSQGGGTTNMAAAFDHRITAIGPGQTFSGLQESLEPNGCVKASIDAAIFALAYQKSGSRTDAQLAARWSAYLGAGVGADQTLHDWSVRSPRMYVRNITQPSLWVQAFDDPLFPIDQAVLMHHLEANPANRLWLSWGGHFTNGSSPEESAARETEWHRWMQHWLHGRSNGADRAARVTWWYRAADGKTLVRRTSPTWPPPGTASRRVALSNGSVEQASGAQGIRDDAFVGYAAGLARVGSVLPMLPNHSPADTLSTTTPPLRAPVIYAGAATARIRWTSTAPESQVNVKVWDVAPNGSVTLLGRACQKVVAAVGQGADVRLELSHDAVEIPAGHHFEVWVQPADAPSFKPPQVPGVGTVLPGSVAELPLLATRR